MRRLDASALRLANSLGCPSCRASRDGEEAEAGGAAAAQGEATVYAELQPVAPWPAEGAGARTGGVWQLDAVALWAPVWGRCGSVVLDTTSF
jgi:hypothetical protein